MDYYGCLFWAPDIPLGTKGHFIVVASPLNVNGKYYVFTISSIKENLSGMFEYNGKRCVYYDCACVLEDSSIKVNGKNILDRCSFIYYKYPYEFSPSEFLSKQILSKYKLVCKLDSEVLNKIQEGASNSEDSPEYIEEYFSNIISKNIKVA